MTLDEQTPDLWDPTRECGAWRKMPRIIGGPSHTHVCRQLPDHPTPHVCTCGKEF